MSEEQDNNKIPLQTQDESNKENIQKQAIEGNVELQQLPQGQTQPYIQSQPPFQVTEGSPQGYPQPQVPPQGYAQPQGPPQGYAQPQGPPQGYAQPQVPPQGYAQPQGPPQGYAQPQGPPQGYVQPQGPPQGAPFPVPPGFTQQPPQQQPIQWMPAPTQVIANCPPGLEYLTQVDQILVHQQVEFWEIATGYQTANRYIVKNTLGQQIYFAAEESNLCCRQYCGIHRPFTLSILDNSQNEVIHMVREFSCSTHFYCFWARQRMEVQSPPGEVVGYVKQECSFWNPRFTLMNAEEQAVLIIRGRMVDLCCVGINPNITFDVSTPDGTSVGSVTKQWSGLAKEYFTTADNFGISFPMDLDVRMKAVVLGACFLIDYIFFEIQPRGGRRR